MNAISASFIRIRRNLFWGVFTSTPSNHTDDMKLWASTPLLMPTQKEKIIHTTYLQMVDGHDLYAHKYFNLLPAWKFNVSLQINIFELTNLPMRGHFVMGTRCLSWWPCLNEPVFTWAHSQGTFTQVCRSASE
jgi:hypothetical protein